MLDSIFREYDIRGVIDNDFPLIETYNLGRAIATYLKNNTLPFTHVVIGRDARTHSTPICTALIQAFSDSGINVIDIGIVPTPVFYFAMHHLKQTAGLVITASHNPKEYNGIKFWGLWGSQIQAIKLIYQTKNFLSIPNNPGNKTTYLTIIDEYIAYLVNHFAHLKNIPIDTVFDCGNGMAGAVMPKLIKQMNWKNAPLLFEEVDGEFPNHEADPTEPENMRFVQHALKVNQSISLGIGFDGDCDRMGPMLKNGSLVPGDKLLALFAQKVLKENPHAGVVFDIKASSALMDVLSSLGAQQILSPSGHSNIKDAIKKNPAILLGGELSCHFFFNDRYFGYDDAFYAALRLIEMLYESRSTLEQLLTIIPMRISSREIRIKCRSDAEKIAIVNHVKQLFLTKKNVELITIDGLRAQMPYGWGLIRASNTQPVVSLRFESNTIEGITRVKNDFSQALDGFFTSTELDNAIAQ